MKKVLIGFVLLGGVASAQMPQIPQSPYVAGQSYFGRNGYIEYIAGDSPLIFSAPHGGSLVPAEIPDRTSTACGSTNFVTGADRYTQELAREIRAAFVARTGKTPHLVINRLHRKKLDANRSIKPAACRDTEAEIAWQEYSGFLDLARQQVARDFGRGWYTDVHGHGHAIQRLELGYEIPAADLRLSDAELDTSSVYEDKATFRTFSHESPLAFSALLRGPTSLGTLFVNAGYPAAPSAQDPAPDEGEPFFDLTNYNAVTFGCRTAGTVCGLQLETNYDIRASAASRAAFAASLVEVYAAFLPQIGITF
jgi:hypothetical protein